MTRTLTLSDYLLEALNRRAKERGEDVELVFERPAQPKPWVATTNDNVVRLADRERSHDR